MWPPLGAVCVCPAALSKIARPLVVMKAAIHRKGLHETHRLLRSGRRSTSQHPRRSHSEPFLCFSFEIWTMATATNRGAPSFPSLEVRGDVGYIIALRFSAAAGVADKTAPKSSGRTVVRILPHSLPPILSAEAFKLNA
jgi:hypothetical protein